MEKISASFELISHPDRTLRTHLSNCNAISRKALQLKHIDASTFYSAELLEEMRHLLVYFHDFGKGSFFQYKIIKATEEATNNIEFKNSPEIQAYITFFNTNRRKEYEEYLEENDRLGNHAKLGAYFVLSNFQNEDPILGYILLKIIRRHHGNLNNFFKDSDERPQILLNELEIEDLDKQIEHLDFELYQQILDSQKILIDKNNWPEIKSHFSSGRRLNKIEISFERQGNIKYFFLQHLLFSLLLSADKGDMMIDRSEKENLIKENQLLPNSIIDNYKKEKHKNDKPRDLDKVREEAYQLVTTNAISHSQKGFFSITLPTGLGKTYCAYNTAIILQNAYHEQHGTQPRIVYVLPFTSIIDQNESILRDVLSKSGIENLETRLSKNHYLSTANDRYDEEELNRDEPDYLTEGWEHDIIVTTFVQFLEGIFTDQNRLLRKFHNMTNAIFILDEVQNIPPQYFEAIEVVFKKMNEYFGTKFVFVTATQPFLFEHRSDIQELADPKKYFEGLARITLDQSLLKNQGKIELDDFIPILLEDIELNSEKSFLIICNTIKSSQEIYKAISDKFGEILYLSSSILPNRRMEVINQIKQAKSRQIVVSTQVVEAGVDIDLDIVYRDFAPLDSINQSAGRCNRNGEKGGGIVKLFNLDKAKYIYDKVLLSKTQEILREYPETIQESQLYELNEKYATAVRKGKAEANDDSIYLIKAMKELRTEDIAKKFKLIEADYRNYNVFLPIDENARHVWQQYVSIIKETEDSFELKRKIKRIKPQLLQYVTRFPKNKFVPPDSQKDKKIMYISNWEENYDLKTGFKSTDDQTFIL